MQIKEKEEKEKEVEKEKENEKEKEEPEFEILSNPARVTLRQKTFITFDVDDRYSPVKTDDLFGIVLLKDNKPELPEEFVSPAKAPTTDSIEDEDEPEPPEPFEFDPEKED